MQEVNRIKCMFGGSIWTFVIARSISVVLQMLLLFSVYVV